MIKLLVVDDSALLRKLVGQLFAAEGDFDVSFARSGAEALNRLSTFAPDVITLDVQMPEMNGLECLDRIMVQRPCPVVMVSSQTAQGADATLEALRLGAVDFVPKPGGAVSLHMDDLGPQLVSKVRAAAGAKIRSSLRLRERVRNRIMGAGESPPAVTGTIYPAPLGEGLVLIGVSTGGPPALETVLTALPAQFPWPILVAQHMPASFTGPLARRLDGLCDLTVSEVVGPTLLKPGCVYIGHGDCDLVLSRRPGGLIALAAPASPGYLWRPSADRLVRTAMEHMPPRQLIGVLMTGMGDDGATAMSLLHERGGRTIAESADTAVVWGMPGELVKLNGADWIIPLPEIADHLQKLTAPCR